MTDLELVRLVQDSLPEELSSEQIAVLRRRMPHSPELREALVEQLELEQTLCGALGEVHVSLDWIFAQAASASAAGGIAKLFGWGATTALVVAVTSIGVLVEPPWAAAPKPAPVHLAQAAAVAQPLPLRADEPPLPADEMIGPAALQNTELEADSPSDVLVPAPVTQRDPAGGVEREARGKSANTIQPPLVADEIENAGLFAELPGADFERLNARLEALEAAHQPVAAEGERQAGMTLGGLARLNEPWSAGTALRLRPAEGQRLRLHLWNGVQGISLELHDQPRPGWAAYRTTRRANDLRPLTRGLMATDSDRYVRCGQGTVDLRWHEGQLTLARGDVPLLAVPCPAPETVVFDGFATIRDLSLVPCKSLLCDEPVRTNALDSAAPDQLEWKRELPPGAQWSSLAEGRGELLAEDTSAPAWAAVAVAHLGLREIVFELEDPLPGTGVYLGDEAGRPVAQLGFFSDETTGQTCFGFAPPGDMRMTARAEAGQGTALLSDLRPWIRLVLSGGAMRCSVSGDGRHWSAAMEGLSVPNGGFSTAGLYALPGGGTRCLRVRRIEARRLSVLESLAPLSLRAQVSGLDSAVNFAGWQQAVLASLPPGVGAEAWRRACAVELLAAATRPDLASAVVLDLLDGAMADEALSADARLSLLSEAALLFDASSPEAAEAFARQYERLGYALMSEAGAWPYSAVRRSLMTTPLATSQPLDAIPPSLVRAELNQLAASEAEGVLHDFRRRLAFFAGDSAPNGTVRDGCDHQEIRELLAKVRKAGVAITNSK